MPSTVRAGIAQAVVVGDRTYLVDCGSGVTRQLRRARLLAGLHAVFLTHLHSDHTCDYFNLFHLGWPILQWNPPVAVYGPGGAAALPADEPGHPAPVVRPDNPAPGLLDLTASLISANAYDINIRMREAGRADLTTLLLPHEIDLPPAATARAPGEVAPAMAPFTVLEDDRVRVTAVLVRHGPVFPAFAFRFDTADGAVVLSGDTAPCPNLLALAAGADILVHEVYDDGVGYEPDDDERGSWEADRRHHHLVTAHTPLSRVGGIATDAGARQLVLTHFIPGDDTQPDEHWRDGLKGSYDGQLTVGRDLIELPL